MEAYRRNFVPPNIQIPPIAQLAGIYEEKCQFPIMILDQIQKALKPGSVADYTTYSAGLWPRVTPKILLRRLSLHERQSTPEEWIPVIIEYAYAIALVQRTRRLLRLATLNQVAEFGIEFSQLRLQSSRDNMDWMLFEIDSDRSIRPYQFEIARAMIKPEIGENAVMQLNMGEGKSSVNHFFVTHC
jgi:hypothetical protein